MPHFPALPEQSSPAASHLMSPRQELEAVAAKAAEQERGWVSASALPKVPVVVPITAFLHMEAKHSHRTTLAIGMSTDISISGHENIPLVPSLSFYKNHFINP